MSIQSTIQSKAAGMAPAARRVADAILADPELPLRQTISELARTCDTSETSIVRFCRAIGLTGYVQLRLALATEIGRETAQFGAGYGEDITPDDTLSEIIGKVASMETMGIQETIAGLDLAELERVVAALDGARRIVTFGIGASGSGAEDLHRKLFRIGRVAFAPSDPHAALTAAALLKPGDVVVGLSHGGGTREVVQVLQAAARAGATTVAITNTPGSRVAEAADFVLFTAVREVAFRSGAMASRIAQLTLIDCVFLGVAQRRYRETLAALQATHEAVNFLPGEAPRR